MISIQNEEYYQNYVNNFSKPPALEEIYELRKSHLTAPKFLVISLI